jgi:hypothetical protein
VPNNAKATRTGQLTRLALALLIAAGCDVGGNDPDSVEKATGGASVVTPTEPAPAPAAEAETAPAPAPAAEAETVPVAAATVAPAVEAAPATMPVAPAARPTIQMNARVLKFVGWLDRSVRASEASVANLYYAYYDAAKRRPWFLSPMVSADVLRFFLQVGDVARAAAIGDAILHWQNTGEGVGGERVAGAFPSELDQDKGVWVAKPYYDSHDNLVIIEALLDLAAATAQPRYLQAAVRAGAWLRDVMAHGERYGVWVEAHGAPMKFVTASGDFDNRIAVGRTLLWLPTLHRLAAAAQDDSFVALAESTRAFLLRGQDANGGFADHYDPGYPAQPFDAARFRPYGPDGSVVADDSIRAALGALLGGDKDAAERFTRWLPRAEGRIPGYLGLDTGKPRFTSRDRVYHDVMSTALYERLAQRLDLTSDVASARTFLEGTQGDDGSWFWGVDAEMNRPVNSDQATLIGLWAFADLCPRA